MAAAGADAIEVWNEPNIDREWPNGQVNGANYTQLLAKAYNAIKGANPGTMVVSAALAPTGFVWRGGCRRGWLQRRCVLAANGGGRRSQLYGLRRRAPQCGRHFAVCFSHGRPEGQALLVVFPADD